MTLCLATLTGEGIVISADSRQTYMNNKGMIRIGSDNAIKLFRLNDRMGLAIAGRAFLEDASTEVLKNISWFIDQFKLNFMSDAWSVGQTKNELNTFLIKSLFTDKLLEYLEKELQEKSKKEDWQDFKFERKDDSINFEYKKDGKIINDKWRPIETIDFIVAGIDDDGIGRAYNCHVPNSAGIEQDTNRCGAIWIGQTDILTRIIKGFDPNIEKLTIFQSAIVSNPALTQQSFNPLEYVINWGTMTLQDAIDFCVLMTKTTESIQKFSDGTQLQPGGITGVGGDIDIAVITPERGFMWVKRKQLQAEGEVLDMNKHSKLKSSVKFKKKK